MSVQTGIAALALGSCLVLTAGLGIRNSSSVRTGTAATPRDGAGAPTCSPVCADALDVVVVLGTSEAPLTATDGAYLRRMSTALLKHFDLSRTHGSLFGFIDISPGLAQPLTVAPLGDDRQALSRVLDGWTPRMGGAPVTAGALQGLENRPELLAMLKNARPKARRTLLVLTLPPKDTVQNTSAVNFPMLLSAKSTGLTFDEQVMQFLTSVCPAVTIDPSLECGRMRWGHGSNNSGSGELNPFGKL